MLHVSLTNFHTFKIVDGIMIKQIIQISTIDFFATRIISVSPTHLVYNTLTLVTTGSLLLLLETVSTNVMSYNVLLVMFQCLSLPEFLQTLLAWSHHRDGRLDGSKTIWGVTYCKIRSVCNPMILQILTFGSRSIWNSFNYTPRKRSLGGI